MKKHYTVRDREQVKKLYDSGHTMHDLSNLLNVSESTICRWMRELGIKARPHSHKIYTKGRNRLHARGYILIYSPNHPNAQATGYIFEHRIIMEQYLGRLLRPDEYIHHINENRSDNRIENLKLVSKGDHSRLHNTGKIEPTIKICSNCGKIFTGKNKKFCSKKCYYNFSSVSKICLLCTKQYRIKKSHAYQSKYCSRICKDSGRRRDLRHKIIPKIEKRRD